MKRKLLSLAILLSIASCSTPQSGTNNVNVSQAQNSNITVQPSDVNGFDVNNFATLLKTQKNPQALEQAINASGNNINNLDLNNNDTIDYVKVVETGANTLQVIDDTSVNGSVVIATLTVTPNTNTMAIQGNQDYCGSNYAYTSHYSTGDMLFMAYLLSSHSYYHPMWHYGYYPRYYGYGYRSHYAHPYTTRSVVTTRTYRTTPRVNNTSSYRNTGGTNRKSLNNSSTFQRSFQARQAGTPVKSGGFGKTMGTKSSSSFGSGRSSFGSGSRSFGGGGRGRR